MQEIPDLIHHLRERLRLPLPGSKAQFRMAHLTRIAQTPVRPDVRKAAVMILLFERAAEWHLVFIQRKAIDGDVHAGQISFPGGRSRSDESLEEAALRESHEEINSPTELITVLGQLTQLHIPVSNHLVLPIVAFLSHYSGWRPQESEVDMILEVPVDFFLRPETRVISSIRLRDGATLENVPCYQVHDHLIWGATAMILSEFVEVLSSLEGI
jgi:8-oxo-dGTP pyrophosphatase MutT (NUDIX family)